MRAARMPGLALAIDRPKASRRFAKIANHAVAGTRRGLEIGTASRVANGRRVAADAGAPLVEQLTEITPKSQHMLQIETMETTPGPIRRIVSKPRGKARDRPSEGFADEILAIMGGLLFSVRDEPTAAVGIQ